MYREFVEKNIKQQQLNTFIKKSGSAIIQELLNAEEFPGFETFIEKELIGMDKDVEFSEPSLLRRGLYYSQVKRYMDLFGKQNILIIGFKDLVQDKKSVLNQILKFLQLFECDWEFLNEEKRHSFTYKTSMDPKINTFLSEYYKSDTEKLFSLIGHKLNW